MWGRDEADADAVDAAVGAGEDFEAEAVLFDYLSGQGDVAGDLGDEAAECGGLVVLGDTEGGGVVAGVAEVVLFGGVGGVGCGGFAGLRFHGRAAAGGLELVGEEVAETRDFIGAGDDVGAVVLADGSIVGLGLVVLVGDVAYDGLDEVFDGDEAGDAAVLVDDDTHVLLFALHLAEELGDLFGFGDEGGGTLDLGDAAVAGVGIEDLEEVAGEGDA